METNVGANQGSFSKLNPVDSPGMWVPGEAVGYLGNEGSLSPQSYASLSKVLLPPLLTIFSSVNDDLHGSHLALIFCRSLSGKRELS